MTKLDFIKEILETIEDGEHDLFWYIDNKDEAARYILNKLEEWEYGIKD